MVVLEPVTDANRAAALALRVAPGQERFVTTVAESLREAAEHPAARARCLLVVAGATPVGFAMVVDEVEGDEYLPHYLWKLLIDAQHQGRGFGTATLDRLVDRLRDRPGVEALTTSARLGEGSPLAFYERYGFERVGAPVGGEVRLRLRLG